MPASLHIGDGIARLGGVTLPTRASARGLELGGDAVLQPISFGLRSRLVSLSADDLAQVLLAEMLDGDAGDLNPLALQALALHLAGADSGAPGFAASAALVARLLGWPPAWRHRWRTAMMVAGRRWSLARQIAPRMTMNP